MAKNKTEFYTPTLLISDYYENLVAQIDIYAEEVLKKLNNGEIPVKQPIEYTENASDEAEETYKGEVPFCTEFRNSYQSKYSIESSGGDEIWINRDQSAVGLVNEARLRAIEEINRLKEDCFKHYHQLDKTVFKVDRDKLDEETVEGFRKCLLEKQFCLILVSEKSPEQFFKLSVVVTDFYVRPKHVELIKKLLDPVDGDNDVEDLDDEDEEASDVAMKETPGQEPEPLVYENILDEDHLLAYLVSRYVSDRLSANKSKQNIVIHAKKSTLLSIEEINYENGSYDGIQLDGDYSRVKSLVLGSSKTMKRVYLNGFRNVEHLLLLKSCLNSRSIENLTNIRSMTLYNCELSNFGQKSFNNLHNLNFVHFLFTRPSRFMFDFDQLSSLTHFHFSNFKITNSTHNFIQTLDRHEQIKCLELHFTYASCETLERFLGRVTLPNLQVLNLTGSRIGNLDRDVFSNLVSLRTLYLYNSEIESVDFGDVNRLVNLEHLNLGQNRITTIKNETFSSLKSLKSLILKSNYIETIEENAFIGMTNLKEVNLVSNVIITIDRGVIKFASEAVNVYTGGNNVM